MLPLDPFGYDKNDLNLDHFTHNIIRKLKINQYSYHPLSPPFYSPGNELRAVTSAPPPDPESWAFVAENNLLFVNNTDNRISPDEWISKGPIAMQRSLGQF